MKKIFICVLVATFFISACATVQSIVRSTFPYTATLIIPSNAKTGTTFSATSTASSLDQIFTGQSTNNNQISQVRMASAKVDAVSPSSQNLGVFKSINLYLVNGSSQVLVATRTDIAASAGRSLMLDIDNSKFLDDYLKSGSVRIKMEYVLQNNLTVDLSVKASLGFNVAPATPN